MGHLRDLMPDIVHVPSHDKDESSQKQGRGYGAAVGVTRNSTAVPGGMPNVVIVVVGSVRTEASGCDSPQTLACHTIFCPQAVAQAVFLVNGLDR